MIKSNAVANTLLMYGPFLFWLLVVIALNPVLSLSIIVIADIVGLIILFRSKLSLFRRGTWFSFGPGKLDNDTWRRYIAGYAIIGCAMILNLVSIALFRTLYS